MMTAYGSTSVTITTWQAFAPPRPVFHRSGSPGRLSPPLLFLCFGRVLAVCSSPLPILAPRTFRSTSTSHTRRRPPSRLVPFSPSVSSCTMSTRRSDSHNDDSTSESTPPLPTPSLAMEQAAMARIDKFVRQAGALGLRVERMTIAPAPVPHGRHTHNQTGPNLIFCEQSSSGPCVVTVEPPTAGTGSSRNRPFEEPVAQPSETEAEAQPSHPDGMEDNGHPGGIGNGAGRGIGGATAVGPSGAGTSVTGDGQGGVSCAAGRGNSGSE